MIKLISCETNNFSWVWPALLSLSEFSWNMPEVSINYLSHCKVSFTFYTKTQVITKMVLNNEIAVFFDY